MYGNASPPGADEIEIQRLIRAAVKEEIATIREELLSEMDTGKALNTSSDTIG
jgi:hypothetical protein